MKIPSFLGVLTGAALAVLPVGAESLLKSHPLDGDVATTYWTFLASQNPFLIPDSPSAMTGTMTVATPGYGASMGLYSWTGPYSMTVKQAAAGFDIQQAVYQLDVTWDPAVTFPYQNGPLLSYNGGTQRIRATLPMVVDGLRVVNNDTGIPEMKGIESFAYRGVTWQWDLSGVAEVIQSVQITMPFANHTSVVGARIDVASEFLQVGGAEPTPLETWRQNHFQTTENSGRAADDADYDGDGLANLIEYALGTDPTVGGGANGASSSPRASLPADRLQLAFSIPTTAPTDLTYRVKVSDDLANWTVLASKTGTAAWVWSGEGESRITLSASGARSEVRIDDVTPATGRPRRLMILEVSH